LSIWWWLVVGVVEDQSVVGAVLVGLGWEQV
jgi:hypothetical protein